MFQEEFCKNKRNKTYHGYSSIKPFIIKMESITRQFSFGDNLWFNHDLQTKEIILVAKKDNG